MDFYKYCLVVTLFSIMYVKPDEKAEGLFIWNGYTCSYTCRISFLVFFFFFLDPCTKQLQMYFQSLANIPNLTKRKKNKKSCCPWSYICDMWLSVNMYKTHQMHYFHFIFRYKQSSVSQCQFTGYSFTALNIKLTNL